MVDVSAGVGTWAYHGTDHFREERAKFVHARERRKDVVKLHLGCGTKKFREYINIDSTGSPDVFADITALPYSENYADEILAVHVFEHIFPQKSVEVLRHWHKILKPGGKLVMEMPDLKKVLEFFKDPKSHPALTMFALYGGEQTGRIEDVHKWCWTFDTLKPLLEQAGFKEVVEKHASYHIPARDFRVEGTK